MGPGATTVESVLNALAAWLPDCEGITVSGGEPFDQPAALECLLRELRTATATDVLVFSGHPFHRLRPWLARAPGLIDALVSEPYDSQAPQTLALRGSDNQRLHLLTALGRDRFSPFERPMTAADRRLDVMFDDNGEVWFAGIPARGDFSRLAETLREAGHQVVLSTAPTAERAS
jgi:anaerobic ribonucleoside-triphosphate reductase activating protein